MKPKTKERFYIDKSKQYKDGIVPNIEKEERAEVRDYIIGNSKCMDVPSCKMHGALICYEHNIYRCIECGWAVKKWKKHTKNYMI